MKKKLSKLFNILFYMVAGVGLLSLINLISKGFSKLPALLVIIGLCLGLLMWWRETKAMKEMKFGGNIKALKFYVYAFQLLVYVTAFFGFVELFSLYFGLPSIEVYESEIFSWNSYTFSWEWIFYPLIYILGWQASAQNIIDEALMNMKTQKA